MCGTICLNTLRPKLRRCQRRLYGTCLVAVSQRGTIKSRLTELWKTSFVRTDCPKLGEKWPLTAWCAQKGTCWYGMSFHGRWCGDPGFGGVWGLRTSEVLRGLRTWGIRRHRRLASRAASSSRRRTPLPTITAVAATRPALQVHLAGAEVAASPNVPEAAHRATQGRALSA